MRGGRLLPVLLELHVKLPLGGRRMENDPDFPVGRQAHLREILRADECPLTPEDDPRVHIDRVNCQKPNLYAVALECGDAAAVAVAESTRADDPGIYPLRLESLHHRAIVAQFLGFDLDRPWLIDQRHDPTLASRRYNKVRGGCRAVVPSGLIHPVSTGDALQAGDDGRGLKTCRCSRGRGGMRSNPDSPNRPALRRATRRIWCD